MIRDGLWLESEASLGAPGARETLAGTLTISFGVRRIAGFLGRVFLGLFLTAEEAARGDLAPEVAFALRLAGDFETAVRETSSFFFCGMTSLLNGKTD